jgi:hypothetical protein
MNAGWSVRGVSLGVNVCFIKGSISKLAEPQQYATTIENDINEKNVIRAIADHLDSSGYCILTWNDGERHERGPDISAEKNGVRYIIEAKGYPSTLYERTGPLGKKGEKKRTHPATQARHWFSEALFQVILAKEANPSIKVALGLPERKVYLNFLKQLTDSRRHFEIHTFLLKADGTIAHILPEDELPK